MAFFTHFFKHYTFLTATILLTQFSAESFSQSSCANIDFEMGDLSGWTGKTGTCCPINTPNSGIVNGRHTIMSGPGLDPNTCDSVPVVYPGGGNYSARLGNSSTGRQAERLTYTFLVSPSSSLFIYRYAVVLQDPNHSQPEQPRFEIKVLDASGNLIDPVCGLYSVVASASIPGFRSCGTVRYKNWTTVGIDLSAFQGQSISIEFSTGDCSQGAHYGYAYLEASCSPLQITGSFCSNSSIPAVLTAPEGFSYLWSTGDTTRTVALHNPTPGSVYSVTITSVTGCSATLSTQLYATVVNANFNVTSYCQQNVTFADASTYINEAINEWYWDFGDGQTSTDRYPVHSYAAAGPHQVTLITSTPSGCKDTISNIVDVIENPKAEFALTNVCIGTPLSISNTSSIVTSSISTYNWNDGNGNTSSDLLPTFVYQDTGTYRIELIVTAANGCTDSNYQYTKVNRIDAAFNFQDDCVGIPTVFNDNSNAYGTNIVSWYWQMGEGTTDTVQSPVYTYPVNGSYHVTLDVLSDKGCVSQFADDVTIYPKPYTYFSYGADTTFCDGDVVAFSDHSIIQTGSIISRSWAFGDGIGSSTDAYPTYTYPDSGTYTISLSTISDHGCISSMDKNIYVYDYPQARFSAESLHGCMPLATAFTDSSSSLDPGGASWNWSFGDGSFSDEQHPTHVYNSPGVYDVELTVSNYLSCFGTQSKKELITVLTRPVSDFVMDPEQTTIFMPDINFSERSQLSKNWYWDFGDNSTYEGPSTMHRYYEPGRYTVMLVSENENGCTDTISKIALINPEFSVFAPNAFSPNGDGKNDFFEISGQGIESVDLVILNRWGEEIFVTKSFEEHWDGSYRNSSIEAQNDVYVWKAKVLDIYGDTHTLSGKVTLIK
ncbi:MAG: PKD domain-containing protein [Bacteroidetes bacterium]|nr:MAG: PKD domain-containing protein [Bacteroidota bacterium]